jgi:hypothetical protein
VDRTVRGALTSAPVDNRPARSPERVTSHEADPPENRDGTFYQRKDGHYEAALYGPYHQRHP